MRFGSSPIGAKNLVASTTSSRRLAIALPTISSDSPAEYTSAVSMKLMPASSAALMMRTQSSWSGLPQTPNIMAPRQNSLTWTPLRPNGRVFMAVPYAAWMSTSSWPSKRSATCSSATRGIDRMDRRARPLVLPPRRARRPWRVLRHRRRIRRVGAASALVLRLDDALHRQPARRGRRRCRACRVVLRRVPPPTHARRRARSRSHHRAALRRSHGEEGDGEWRIARRRCVFDWTRRDPIVGEWPLPPEALQGRRDRSDPAYDRTRTPASRSSGRGLPNTGRAA